MDLYLNFTEPESVFCYGKGLLGSPVISEGIHGATFEVIKKVMENFLPEFLNESPYTFIKKNKESPEGFLKNTLDEFL